jgi:mono/diheme cytochrome c family protein
MRRIPDFTDSQWHVRRSDRELARSVLEGRGSMPAMKTKLRADDLGRIIRLVRNFQGGKFEVPEDKVESENVDQPQPAHSSAASPPEPSTPLAGTASSKSVANISDAARGLYQRFCIACHGEDGRSGPLRSSIPSAPDFTSAAWHGQRSDQKLIISIHEGRGTRMPPFEGKITDVQAVEIVAYLRSFAGPGAPAKTNSEDEFGRRFQDLMRELNDLQQQYRALPQPVVEIKRVSRD